MLINRAKIVCMTWLKDLYISRQYTGSLYHSSGVLARQTEKLAKEIWAPSGLTPGHGHLLPVLKACQKTFAARCDELLGKEETASLAASMCKAADELTVKEG